MEHNRDISIMEPEEMTRQKWEVLWYFVVNTGVSTKPGLQKGCGVRYPTESGGCRFYSYPSRIHEDFGTSYLSQGKTSISKDWAGKICEDLSALGILGSVMIRAPRQSGKTPHYYLKEGNEPYLRIMKYLFRMIRDPGMQRALMNAYIMEHTSAGLVRYILSQKGVEIQRSIPLRDWDVYEAPKVFEQYVRTESVNGSAPPCSFVTYTLEQSNCAPVVALRLPVFPDGLSDEERMTAIESGNRETFARHPWLKRYQSGIGEHYLRFEYQHWILPILALIRASPAALEYFLFGDWKPYSGSLDYPLFTLMFTAVRDLALVRDVEHDPMVEMVRFHPEHMASRDDGGCGSALLEIDLENGRTVCYDGAFTTDQRSPATSENTAIRPAREANYSFRSWVTIPVSGPGGVLFAPEDLPAALRFLRHLRDTRTLAARDILGRLSHRVQNIIAIPGDGDVPAGSPAGQAVIRDLNEILLCDDLYTDRHFPDLHLTGEGERVIFPDSSSPSPTAGMHTVTWAHFNRELLERAFPGVMPAREQPEGETQYFA
jgi:hypothetical protein